MEEGGGPAGAGIGLASALPASFGVQVLASISVFALPVLAPVAALDIGVSPAWIGLQTSLIYLVAAAVSVMAVPILLRHGPVRTSQVALMAAALGLMTMTAATFAFVVLSAMMIGFGYALTNPAGAEILSRARTGRHRNLAFSIKQTAVPAGAMLAGAVLPVLATHLGWRLSMLVAAAAMIPLAVLLQGLRPAWDIGRPAPRERPLRAAATIANVVSNPPLRVLAAIGFLYSAIQLALGSYAVVMLVDEFGWSLLAAGSGAACLQLGGVFGRVFWGAVADRFGNGFLVLGVTGVATAGAAALLPLSVALSPPVAMAILAIIGATAIGWNGVLLAEVTRRVDPAEAGSATAIILMFTFVGVIVGPVVLALLSLATGSYSVAFSILGVAPLLAAVFLFRTFRG